MRELTDLICSNNYNINELNYIVMQNIYINNCAPVFKGFTKTCSERCKVFSLVYE